MRGDPAVERRLGDAQLGALGHLCRTLEVALQEAVVRVQALLVGGLLLGALLPPRLLSVEVVAVGLAGG